MALHLAVTVVVMVLVLYAVALLGGVGSVELGLWAAMLVVALVVAARWSRRQVNS
jgi:hypothetical protein